MSETTETNNKRKRGRPFANQTIDLTLILEVAIQVFAEKGFDGAQLKEIAKRSDISNSMITYHFKDKEDLWKQAIERLGQKLVVKLQNVKSFFKDLEGIPALKAYTRQYIYFSAEHPEYFKVMFHEMCTKTDRAKWLIHTFFKPLYEFWSIETIKSTKRTKAIAKEYPTSNFSTIIIGAANMFFINAFQMQEMYGIDPFEPAQIEKHADIVISVLFSSLE